jgi:type IV pilus assembly protein PilA
MLSFFRSRLTRYRQSVFSTFFVRKEHLAPCGQGMTEYIVVVAVVAVAAIGVYSMLGQTIRNQTAGIAQEISGNDAGAALNAATSSASAARSQANVRKDLKNYNQDNH